MKKLIALVLLPLGLHGYAQNLPVSQNTENKKAVLEEFTGYRCGNCPEGHQIAGEIAAMHSKGDVISIRYHRGSLATPRTNDPDFRTDEGNALGTFYGVSGVPLGLVNREQLQGRTAWESSVMARLGETADVNVALDVTIDAFTREATINTEAFYTTNSNTTHYLTIGYVENEIVAPQTSYNAAWNADYFNADGSYRHQHLFRGYINGDTGTAIDANTASVITNNFSFTIPLDLKGNRIDLSNLQFFAFIHAGINTPADSDILNGAQVDPTINGTVGVEEESPLSALKAFPNPSNNGEFKIEGLNQNAQISVVDLLGKSVPFELNRNNLVINSKGVYFINISENNFRKSLRVMVL